MFWVALATLIMALTGKGDDTRFFTDFLADLREGIEEEVPDPKRQAKALDAVEQTLHGFKVHRTKLHHVGNCLEDADRNYEATTATYEACLEKVPEYYDQAVDRLLTQRARINEALTVEERARIMTRIQAEEE